MDCIRSYTCNYAKLNAPVLSSRELIEIQYQARKKVKIRTVFAPILVCSRLNKGHVNSLYIFCVVVMWWRKWI